MDSSFSPILLTATLMSSLAYSLVAAADAALGALPPSRLAALHEQAEGETKGRLQRFIDNPSKVLGRWLVARVLFSSLTAISLSELLETNGQEFRPVLAVGGSLLVLSLLSEATTAVARARAAQVGPGLLWALRPLEVAMTPLADPLSWAGRALGSSLTLPPSPEAAPKLVEAEVEHMLDDATKTGQMAPEPAEMIRNVLDFKDLTVRDVMVPRIKMVGIEADTPLDEVLKIVSREAHSRYPVYAQRVDNVIGLLYAKDLFGLVHGGGLQARKLRDILRAPVNFVPDTQPVSAVLRDMRGRRQHMAVLVDEFGGVSGLVTLEDLLEQIVGEIRDEHDPEDAPIQDLGNGHLLADAAVSLADLSAYLGTDIQGSGDYGSLGGLLMHEAGHMPIVGDRILASGLEFIVRDSDAKRLLKVEIVLPPPSLLPSPPSQRIQAG